MHPATELTTNVAILEAAIEKEQCPWCEVRIPAPPTHAGVIAEHLKHQAKWEVLTKAFYEIEEAAGFVVAVLKLRGLERPPEFNNQKDTPRLQTAVSKARRGVVVIAELEYLATQPMWGRARHRIQMRQLRRSGSDPTSA
jgi:hypothetical protein